MFHCLVYADDQNSKPQIIIRLLTPNVRQPCGVRRINNDLTRVVRVFLQQLTEYYSGIPVPHFLYIY